MTVFAVTVVFYDHALNISKEMEYVWSERPTMLALSVMADVWVREACLLYFAAGMSCIWVQIPSDDGLEA